MRTRLLPEPASGDYQNFHHLPRSPSLTVVSGKFAFSVRLASSRIETVNARLEVVLPLVEADVAAGAIVTVEDVRVRCRLLPI